MKGYKRTFIKVLGVMMLIATIMFVTLVSPNIIVSITKQSTDVESFNIGVYIWTLVIIAVGGFNASLINRIDKL